MVRSRSPIELKLVGSAHKGRGAAVDLDSSAVVLKGQGGGLRRVHCPSDILSAVCSLVNGFGTTAVLTFLEMGQANGSQADLFSTTLQWGGVKDAGLDNSEVDAPESNTD